MLYCLYRSHVKLRYFIADYSYIRHALLYLHSYMTIPGKPKSQEDMDMVGEVRSVLDENLNDPKRK